MLLSDITPAWLKTTFLYGITIRDENGAELPDSVYQFYIDSAIDMAEKRLDIIIRYNPNITERHDVRYNERIKGWGFIQVYQKPILEIHSVKIKFSTNNVVDFPIEWVQYDKLRGQIQFIPYYGISTGVVLTPGGGYLLPTLMAHEYVPQVLEVSYDAGYTADSEIPDTLARLIGMMAAIGVLDVGGDIILGMPALSGYTISMDGLTQTVETTNSATSAAYRGRILSYQNQIDRYIIPALQRYYHNIMVVGT